MKNDEAFKDEVRTTVCISLKNNGEIKDWSAWFQFPGKILEQSNKYLKAAVLNTSFWAIHELNFEETGVRKMQTQLDIHNQRSCT